MSVMDVRYIRCRPLEKVLVKRALCVVIILVVKFHSALPGVASPCTARFLMNAVRRSTKARVRSREAMVSCVYFLGV